MAEQSDPQGKGKIFGIDVSDPDKFKVTLNLALLIAMVTFVTVGTWKISSAYNALLYNLKTTTEKIEEFAVESEKLHDKLDERIRETEKSIVEIKTTLNSQ